MSDTSWELIEEGFSHYDSNNFELAIKTFDEVIKKDPKTLKHGIAKA
jgi:hypothetical protein